MPKTPPTRIPVSALKRLAENFGQTHAVLMAHGPDGVTHVVTWGANPQACVHAAQGGNKMKRAMNWPEELQAEPAVLVSLRKRVKVLESICKTQST